MKNSISNRLVGFSAVAVFAVLAAACGKQDVSYSPNALPTPTPVPTAAPGSGIPDGIYVAAISGRDTNDGTALSPMQTISAATAKAKAAGKHDVYLFGNADGLFSEVVILQDEISIHGGVCPVDTTATTIVIDTQTCPTVISGGSPAMVADGLRHTTIVENVSIVGQDAAQTSAASTVKLFDVPGIGCVGRGNAGQSFTTCSAAVDAEGRMLPQSAIGLAVNDSQNLVLEGVTIVSGTAASGLSGVNGVDSPAAPLGASGMNAGSTPFAGGLPGKGAVNAACPAANGGAGGLGGRWYWDGTSTYMNGKGNTVPLLDHSRGYSGLDGAASAQNAGAGRGAEISVLDQKGHDGADGANGSPMTVAGTAGAHGAATIDLATLVANGGDEGEQGPAGIGGAGGGGGAPASRELYSKTSASASASLYGFGGAAASGGLSIEHDQGETAAGGGGAGGAGGCGGFGGKGGQGGAASVAIYLVDSQILVNAAHLTPGQGGNGGAGGIGGNGGIGGAGAMGGDGYNVLSEKVSGSFSSNANFGWVMTGSILGTFDDGKSASEGGHGGHGGNGGNGGNGGIGGSGAGGASIGILSKGLSTSAVIDGTTVIDPSQPGNAGSTDGETGIAVAHYTI